MAKRTTGDLTIACNQSGVEYTNDLNSSLSALNSMHRGATPPIYDLEDGVLWFDSGDTRVVPSGVLPVLVTTLVSGTSYKITTVTAADWSSVGGPTVSVIGDIFKATATADASATLLLGVASSVTVITGGVNAVRIYKASANNTTANVATTIISGRTYEIATAGTTTFSSLGATSNTVGEVFLATSSGLVSSGNGTAWDINRRFVPLYDFLDVPTPVDATTAPTATAGSDPFINTKRGVRYPDGTVQTTAASGGGGQGISGTKGIIRFNETVLNSTDHGDVNGDIFIGGGGGDNDGETGNVNGFTAGPITVDAGLSVVIASGSAWTIM